MKKNKNVIVGASIYKEQYFLNPSFKKLPENIIKELKTICIAMSAKLHCIFLIGFYSDGKIYIEAKAHTSDYIYDEIGAKLEIDKIIRENKKLISSLELWYKIFILNKKL